MNRALAELDRLLKTLGDRLAQRNDDVFDAVGEQMGVSGDAVAQSYDAASPHTKNHRSNATKRDRWPRFV